MATFTPLYGSPTALTWTVQNLATSSGFTVGRESTAVDNSSVDAMDFLVGGKVTTGSGPTAGQIRIYAYGSYDGTEYTATATGSDAGLTPLFVGQLMLLQIIETDATTRTYKWGPRSIARAFGGMFVPVKWGLFLTHNTVVALTNTAGDHEGVYYAMKLESA